MFEADRKRNLIGWLCNLSIQYLVGLFLCVDQIELINHCVVDIFIRDGCMLKSVKLAISSFKIWTSYLHQTARTLLAGTNIVLLNSRNVSLILETNRFG